MEIIIHEDLKWLIIHIYHLLSSLANKKAAKRFPQKIWLSLRLKSPNRFKRLVAYYIWLSADFPDCLSTGVEEINGAFILGAKLDC